jgi:hypothetical protein
MLARRGSGSAELQQSLPQSDLPHTANRDLVPDESRDGLSRSPLGGFTIDEYEGCDEYR